MLRDPARRASRAASPVRCCIVGAVAAGALVLRLVGLQFGLPAVYNPDEVAIMARALSFAKGTLNPHNFLYPDVLLLRPVRVGRRLSRVRLADRAGRLAGGTAAAVLHGSDGHLHRRPNARRLSGG